MMFIFFFIMFMNVMGLTPASVTPTASIFVTGALAFITFSTMIIGGMIAQGPVAFFKNLVPHVPLILWPLMFVIELTGLFLKPAALMIRLFATMTGGHLVVLSFLALIFLFGFAGNSMAKAVALSPAWVGFSVFVMIIEAFVALDPGVHLHPPLLAVHQRLGPPGALIGEEPLGGGDGALPRRTSQPGAPAPSGHLRPRRS